MSRLSTALSNRLTRHYLRVNIFMSTPLPSTQKHKNEKMTQSYRPTMIKLKTNKIKKSESEFNCYKCFKIMILNLWSADQERPVKIYDGGPRKCYGNIHQHLSILVWAKKLKV